MGITARKATYQKADPASKPRILDPNGEWVETEEAEGFQLTYGMFYEGYKGPREKVNPRLSPAVS